jgi:hypothetical protein
MILLSSSSSKVDDNNNNDQKLVLQTCCCKRRKRQNISTRSTTKNYFLQQQQQHTRFRYDLPIVLPVLLLLVPLFVLLLLMLPINVSSSSSYNIKKNPYRRIFGIVPKISSCTDTDQLTSTSTSVCSLRQNCQRIHHNYRYGTNRIKSILAFRGGGDNNDDNNDDANDDYDSNESVIQNESTTTTMNNNDFGLVLSKMYNVPATRIEWIQKKLKKKNKKKKQQQKTNNNTNTILPILNGSFADALQVARNNGRLLVVLIPITSKISSKTLSNTERSDQIVMESFLSSDVIKLVEGKIGNTAKNKDTSSSDDIKLLNKNHLYYGIHHQIQLKQKNF